MGFEGSVKGKKTGSVECGNIGRIFLQVSIKMLCMVQVLLTRGPRRSP